MRGLTNSEFLQLWERGSGLHPLDRALLALGAAFPETPAIADWPLGRRNAALAELRHACFGPAMRGWVACPRCGERLEFEMDARRLIAEFDDGARSPTVLVKGQSFRLPTSRDLARVASAANEDGAARLLLQQCCVDGSKGAEWADQDLEDIGKQLSLADPLAETRLELRCATCGNEWEESLDLGNYLWAEIEASARRLLMEVHMLAAAYGWSEAEILGLSERRRALYLEMVQA